MRRRLREYDEEVDDRHAPAAPSGINIVAREVTVVTKPPGPYGSQKERTTSITDELRQSRNECPTDDEEFPPYYLPSPHPLENERLPSHLIKDKHGAHSTHVRSQLVGRNILSTQLDYQPLSTHGYPQFQEYSPSFARQFDYLSSIAPNTSSFTAKFDSPQVVKLDTTSCKMDECCRNLGIITGEDCGSPTSGDEKTNVQYQFCPGVNSSQTYLVVPLRLRRGNDDVVVRTAGAVARAAGACSAVVVRQTRTTHAKSFAPTGPPRRYKDTAVRVPSLATSQPPPSTAEQQDIASQKQLTGGGTKACTLSTSPSPGDDTSKTSNFSTLPVVVGAPETPPASPPSKISSQTKITPLELSTVGTQYSQHSDFEITPQGKKENISSSFSTSIKTISTRSFILPKDHSQFTISDMKIPDSEHLKDYEQMDFKLTEDVDRAEMVEASNDVLPSLEDLGPLSVALRDALRLCTELQKVSMMERKNEEAELIAESIDQLTLLNGDASAGDSTNVLRITSREMNKNFRSENLLHHGKEDEIGESKEFEQRVQNMQRLHEVQRNREQQQKLKNLKVFELKHIKALRLGLQEHQKLKLQQMRQQQDYCWQKKQKLEELNVQGVNEIENIKCVEKLQPIQSNNDELNDTKELEKDILIQNILKDSDEIHQPIQELLNVSQEKQICSVREHQHLKKEESTQDLENLKEKASQQNIEVKELIKSANKLESKSKMEIKKQSDSRLKEASQSQNQLTELNVSKKEEKIVEQKFLKETEQAKELGGGDQQDKIKELEVINFSILPEDSLQVPAKNISDAITEKHKENSRKSSEDGIVLSRPSSPSRPPTPYYPWHSTKRFDVSPARSLRRVTTNNEDCEQKVHSDVSDTHCEKDSSVPDLLSEQSALHSSKRNGSLPHSHGSSSAESSTKTLNHIRMRSPSVKRSTPSTVECSHERKWVPARSLVDIMKQVPIKTKEFCTYALPACRKVLELSVTRNSRPSSANSYTPSSRLTSTPISSLQLSSDNQFCRHWPSSQSSGKRSRMHTSTEQLIKSFSRNITTSSSSISSECLLNRPSLELIPTRRITPTGLPSQLSVARSSSYNVAHISTDRLVEEISKELGSLPSSNSSTQMFRTDGKDTVDSDKNRSSLSEVTNQTNGRESKSQRSKDSRKVSQRLSNKQMGRGKGRSTPQLRWLLPPASSRGRGAPTSNATAAAARASPRPGTRLKSVSRRRLLQAGGSQRSSLSAAEKQPPVGKSTLRLLPPTGNERWSLRAVTTATVTDGRMTRGTLRKRSAAARSTNARNNSARGFSHPRVEHSKERQFGRLKCNCSRSSGGSPHTTSTKRRSSQRKQSRERSPCITAPHSAAPRPPNARLHSLRETKGKMQEKGDRRHTDSLVSQSKTSNSNHSVVSDSCKKKCAALDTMLKQGEISTSSTNGELSQDAEKRKEFRRPQDLIFHIMVEASAAANNANTSVTSKTKKEKIKDFKKESHPRSKSQNSKESSGSGKHETKNSTREETLKSRPASSFPSRSLDKDPPLQKATPLKIPGLAVTARTEAEKLLQQLIRRNREREMMTNEKFEKMPITFNIQHN